ncbi:MAG: PH domain-containing protein [Bacteroidaceae bacterium]
MNRIFPPKVGWALYFLIIVLGAQLVYFFWTKEVLVAVLLTMFELYLIEMMLHTRYTVTSDGQLLLEAGRFFPVRTLAVADVESVSRSHSWQTSAALSHRHLRLVCRGPLRKETVCVSPKDEVGFVAALLRHNPDIVVDGVLSV